MIFDIHVHSALSPCSSLEISEILSMAKDRGLDGVCITDHNTMDARRYINEGVQQDGLVVLVGMEYDTPQGDILLFGPMEDIRPGLSAVEVLHLTHERNGFAVAAHPFREDRPFSEDIIRNGLCTIVESINGRNTDKENRMVSRWVSTYPVTVCGGSDAHSIEELGSVVTKFAMPVYSLSDLRIALTKGLCIPEAVSPRVPETFCGVNG
ncbi:MAG TPA: PHP domain-containing protein [Spirochaetota bacterium]|nr:PHP domain-containing protein [Spirochaetota bacterium]